MALPTDPYRKKMSMRKAKEIGYDAVEKGQY